jgi:hypothetical protein
MSELAYTGYIETRDYSGDVSLLIGEKTLVYETPFASVSISYVDITIVTLFEQCSANSVGHQHMAYIQIGNRRRLVPIVNLKIAYNQYVRPELC